MKKLADISMFESLTNGSCKALSDLSVFNMKVLYDGDELYHELSPEEREEYIEWIMMVLDKSREEVTEKEIEIQHYYDGLHLWNDFLQWFSTDFVKSDDSFVISFGKKGTGYCDFASKDTLYKLCRADSIDIKKAKMFINDDGDLELSFPGNGGSCYYTLTKLSNEGKKIMQDFGSNSEEFNAKYPSLPTSSAELSKVLAKDFNTPITYSGVLDYA